MSKPGRGSDQFPLRLPPGMREQIKLAARDSGRSMNQEIVEALREIFPEAPTIDELIGEIEHAASLIEEFEDAGARETNELPTLIGRLYQTSDNLKKALPSGHKLRSVRLDDDVADRVAAFTKEWDLGGTELHESVVNNLVRMSLTRIENREEGFKAMIGDGDGRRIVEIIPPWSQKSGERSNDD